MLRFTNLFTIVDNNVNNINDIEKMTIDLYLYLIPYSSKLNAMTTRSQDLLNIRPEISSAKVYDSMNADEAFQNATLRPIIKLQNDLLIAVFKNYIVKHKNVFYELSLQKQLDYIENAIHKDMKFRNSLKGMIIGHFTVDEYKHYIQNSSALNKRMMHIVKQRLMDSIQLFIKPEVLKAV